MLETTGAETVIASDDDVKSIVGGDRVVDFASYLRQVQPPVQVDGTLGLLCIEDVISHERKRTLARRNITSADRSEWPDVTLDGAGHPGDRHVFIGPTKAKVRQMKLRQLIFANPRDPSASCKHFSLSPDGNLLAVSFRGSDILVWRIFDGLLVQRLHHQGHMEPVLFLEFSPNNHSLVTGSEDATAIIWNIRDDHALLRLRLEGHRGAVRRVVYAPHGALIATISDGDESVKIWNASTGACLHSFDVEQNVWQVAFSLDGSRVYINIHDSYLIYDTQTYTPIAEVRHDNCEMSVSQQGDRIITGSRDDRVKIWSATTGKKLLTINYPRKLSYPVAFSPDGAEVLAACDAGKTAVTFDSWTGQLHHVHELSMVLNHASYSAHGDYVALEESRGSLCICDAKSGVFLARFEQLGDEGHRRDGPRFVLSGQNLVVALARPMSSSPGARSIPQGLLLMYTANLRMGDDQVKSARREQKPCI
ncbi:uncharacterized protein PHACADRAFT_191141 [Phanerochaete carnosa HHB-10118-sp]|uniref:Pyrrolo-quinoline quinone repeat domain-containing protein n=1 Tax=Phanerochaete carnosa (strain HHB-10118-sp) TaxID=650164 RepID=K5X7K2_PHACS|nr:uncharacterized protein PHACADRAFT_191141 [Phanerochaete carnosa HHB-10118-sp]EKM58807.1 hypothetical protein PHACADRAFT_191141 [Phanerochaete carnosa HHB-10118-sp]